MGGGCGWGGGVGGGGGGGGVGGGGGGGGGGGLGGGGGGGGGGGCGGGGGGGGVGVGGGGGGGGGLPIANDEACVGTVLKKVGFKRKTATIDRGDWKSQDAGVPELAARQALDKLKRRFVLVQLASPPL